MASLTVGRPAAGDNDLGGMTLSAQFPPQGDHLGMPHRKDELITARRLRARQHGIGVHARQSFVDQVLVSVAAAER